MTVPIYEILATFPVREQITDEYQYLGPYNGYYAFVNGEGKAELFARRSTPFAGWQLKRGSYFYEFCQSMPN